MTAIVTRGSKGSPLSWAEADANFTNLNTDKIEITAIGSTVQAYSSNLDSFAAVTPTAAGLALIDDASTAAQRTTLGLGNVDNTSDATKNAASVTLTNKTITTPIIIASQNDKLQIGVSATNTQNFTITAEATNGTMKIARGNAGATTQDIMTVDAAGMVAFPQGLRATELTNSVSNNTLTTGVNTKLGSVTLTPGLWVLTGSVSLVSTAASIAWNSAYIGTSTTTDTGSFVRNINSPSVVLNTPANGSPYVFTTRVVVVTADTEYSVYCNHSFSNGNVCGATGTINATRIG